jgi:SPP1 gp7 family putative phage head morphogenesis protein
MNKEYEGLILLFAQILFDNAEKIEKKAYKLQKQDQEKFLSNIANIMLSHTIKNDVLSVADVKKNKIRKDFNTLINNISKNQFNSEKELITDILKTSVKDKYYTSAYVMNLGIDFKLQVLRDEQINKILNEAIEGKKWSDRLWTNKKTLEKELKLNIEQFLQGKTNVNKIEKVIKDTFGSNAFNTKRLVQTEVARCQSSANDLFAEEHGVDEQMFTATLDSKTSNFCREHDGKFYKINDIDKPKLPHHPFERSVYINVPFKGWKPKIRLDNETKQQINYKTYEEWLKDKDITK